MGTELDQLAKPRLAELAAKTGADFIGINPLLALFSADPRRFSPHAPSGRRLLNPLYIAVDAFDGNAEPTPEAPEAARDAEAVDHPAVAAIKHKVLEASFAHFRTRHLGVARSPAKCYIQCSENHALRRGMNSTSNGTLAEEIRRFLADQIARGHLAPGVALEETELARQFGVSRTPVREAIRQLEVLGFAEARPRRGALVAAITKRRLDEMFAVMMELEGLCAREAALQMTPRERAGLAAVHTQSRQCVESEDVEGYYRLNDVFHDLIYEGSHNSYLAELTVSVRQRVAAFRRVQFSGAGRLAGSFKEHGLVVEAILKNDAEAAAAAMRDHIFTVRDAYQTFAPDAIDFTLSQNNGPVVEPLSD